MRSHDTNEEAAETLGLRSLAWAIADEDRAGRLLALTGLDGDALRARLGEPAVLAAVLGFLEAHEPDLIACADALGTRPEALVRARHRLENDA
jgi:hypothetical protein